MIPYIRMLPIHPNWAEVEEIANNEIWLGFYGQVPHTDAMSRVVNMTKESLIGE